MSPTTTCRSLSMIVTRTARSAIHGSSSSYELSWPNSRSVRAPGTRPDRGDLMHASRTFTTRIDIPEQSRRLLIELLNARLADAFDLYSQLKQAHWNVKGSDFIQLHELYDTIAESVLEYVDTIAERATALGGLALGTARMAAAASTLDEYPTDAVAGMDTVAAIADRLGVYGASVRAA